MPPIPRAMPMATTTPQVQNDQVPTGGYLNTLGQMVKSKYPGSYDDLSDTQVAQMIQTKFPGAYSDFQGVDPANSAAHPGFWGGIKDVGLGIVKGIGQVGENVANTVLRPIANAMTGDNQAPQQTPLLDTHNAQQRFGKVVGETLPYLATPELEGASILTNSLIAAGTAGTIAGVQGENPATAALTMGGLTAITKIGGAALEGLQNTLVKKNLLTGLSKSQITKVGGELEKVTAIVKGMPVSSRNAQLGFTQDLLNDMQTSFQEGIQSVAAEPISAATPKATIIKGLESLPQKFAGEDSGFIANLTRKVDQVIKDLSAKPDYLSLADLDIEKIGASQGVYEGLSGKVKDEASDAITDFFRTHVAKGAEQLGIELKVPESLRQLKIFKDAPDTLPVHDFNQLRSALLRTKDILKAGSEANPGFWHRLIDEVIGGAIGHVVAGPMGSVAGAVAGNIVAKKAPAYIVRDIAGKVATKVAPVVKKAIPKIRIP